MRHYLQRDSGGSIGSVCGQGQIGTEDVSSYPSVTRICCQHQCFKFIHRLPVRMHCPVNMGSGSGPFSVVGLCPPSWFRVEFHAEAEAQRPSVSALTEGCQMVEESEEPLLPELSSTEGFRVTKISLNHTSKQVAISISP